MRGGLRDRLGNHAAGFGDLGLMLVHDSLVSFDMLMQRGYDLDFFMGHFGCHGV